MSNYNSDEIVHIKHGDLEYLQFRVLNKYNVKNCITLRHGGVSRQDIGTLNFRTAGTDSIKNILENVRIVTQDINFSSICKAKQAHTDKVITINEQNKEAFRIEKLNQFEVDGYITDTTGIATLVTTADCNPIIIYDTKNNIIANVHAGWKGVINRIYINAINLMEEKYKTNMEDLVVCIGPSIRKCCFTSKEDEFKNMFLNTFNYENEYLEYEKDSKVFHIDLISILEHEFILKGIKKENIHVADICTRCNTKDFFSYRESVQNNRKDYGTMATIVELN